MSNSFVFFGSDTDCDGTAHYACGVIARDEAHAREVLREDFGGMTSDGCYECLPYSEAVVRDPGVAGIMDDMYTHNQEWNGETWVPAPDTPFRYRTLGVNWAPWAGPDGDDSIGIPALDSTYDEPMAGWDL